MDDCLVSLEAMSIALDLMLNAHALVENCQLSCGVVARVTTNPKGIIQFRNNRVIGGAPPTILKDTVTPLPDHDFDNLVTHVEDNFYFPDTPNDKVRSANTKLMEAGMSAANARGDSPWSLDVRNIKTCDHCGRLDDSTKPKMKHCKRCRGVSYCDKRCQEANWGDHKLKSAP